MQFKFFCEPTMHCVIEKRFTSWRPLNTDKVLDLFINLCCFFFPHFATCTGCIYGTLLFTVVKKKKWRTLPFVLELVMRNFEFFSNYICSKFCWLSIFALPITVLSSNFQYIFAKPVFHVVLVPPPPLRTSEMLFN